MQDWKIFEEAVLEYQKKYFPGSTISYDKKIMGQNSKTKRQVDIWIEYKISNIRMSIAFECKKYNKNLDVKKIEEIIGLFDDVGATKGVIFTTKGYSKAAITRADNKGIDLFTLKHRDLQGFTDNIGKIQLVADLRMIKNCNMKAKSRIPTRQINSTTNDISKVQIFDAAGKLIGTPEDIFSRKWNSGHYSIKAGEYKDLEIFDEPVFIIENMKLIQVKYLVSLEVYKDLYQGYLEKEDILTVTDSIENNIVYEEFNIRTQNAMKGTLQEIISKLKKIDIVPSCLTIFMRILVPLGDNKKI